MYVVCVARQHLKQQESRTQISLITGRRERERDATPMKAINRQKHSKNYRNETIELNGRNKTKMAIVLTILAAQAVV